ncbi:LOW QUALITY PROTEIN: Keratin, type II cytoskeletal 8 [Plecturocebus cupreus]
MQGRLTTLTSSGSRARAAADQTSGTCAALSADNGSPDTDGAIAEVKAPHEDIANLGRAEADSLHQIEREEPRTPAGKHGTEVSEKDRHMSGSRLRRRASKAGGPAIADAVQDAEAEPSELEAAPQQVTQHMAQRPREHQAGPGHPAHPLREAAGGQGEPAGICDADHECPCEDHHALSSSYGNITNPSFSHALGSSFGSGGGSSSFSHNSSTRAMIVNKMETPDGKLVSESSDVLPK